ncbi:twin-arginine translocation signal domain-containing protein [Variovorax sp. H27-G14]
MNVPLDRLSLSRRGVLQTGATAAVAGAANHVPLDVRA